MALPSSALSLLLRAGPPSKVFGNREPGLHSFKRMRTAARLTLRVAIGHIAETRDDDAIIEFEPPDATTAGFRICLDWCYATSDVEQC